MRKINSFRGVIEEIYFDDIFNEVSDYIGDNPNKLESNNYHVENPDEAILSDIVIKFIDITNSEGKGILFDVVVSAEIEIAETVKRNRECDGIEQWFRISCSAILDDGLQEFSIDSINIYNRYRNNIGNKLSEHLVPIISKDRLDNEAEKFLRKYYPEALSEPMSVDARLIAERMGLNIQEVHITKYCTVFGQIFFSDCETQYYDDEYNLYKPLLVKRGTILVDPNVFFMRSVGSMNNTIIHECLHWELHRNFFELEKMYNNDAHAIRCQVQEGIRPEINRTPLDWMEWHANHIAPRVLMPAKHTKLKIEKLIKKNKRILQTENIADIMESVVFELSEFFGVSKISAKIRMIDLGYNEAIGVYTYVDNRYVANHAFEKKAIKNNHTFTIGVQDAIYEYAVNIKFRELLDSGNFVYVDSHFCINDSKYIRQNDNGVTELTDYARQHIDECCLIFDVRARKNDKYGVNYYKEAVLFRDAISETLIELKHSDSNQNKATELRAEEFRKIGLEARQIASIARTLPTTFADTLTVHMDRLHCTEEALADYSLIGEKTIQRMRTDIQYKPKLGTIVAICVGLKLQPVLSMDLVAKGGHILKQFDEEHIIYHFILNSKYQCSIYECNEILRANSCKPLSKEI